ncbi:hypothetical protein [Gordonibacter urolithinfaciens]|uniref:hypothetical protein n=1 Tax=Gordonibacter urolithinfaciens TaxID=1335613 RepID=UPI0034B133BE
MTKTSRFNYIKRGLVGVCAATMLTGLCAGAAFGVEGDDTTTVTVTTPAAQVAVTVPTSMTATLGNDGQMSLQGEGAEFTYTDSVYSLQVKSLKVAPETGFTIGDSADTLAKNAFYGTIKFGVSGTPVNLSTYAKDTAVDLATPVAIPTDAKALAISFGSLQVKSLGGAHAGSNIVPFKLIWTVGAAE